MRVLFATPRFPGTGPRGDQQRAWQQLRHLARRHAITLLTPEAPDPAHPARRELSALCERIAILPQARGAAFAHAGRAWLSGRPLQAGFYDGWPPRGALDALLADGRFDLAHVQLARLGGLFDHLRGRPRVIDLVDALSLNMQRRAQRDRAPMRWVAQAEASRLRALEARLGSEADAAVVSSPLDRDVLGRAAALVPNGVDPAEFPFVGERPASARIVFGGNLGYFPNVDAVLWFAREVLPRVRARRPDAVLQLAGARPAAALRLLARREAGVELVGPVPRMHPWLAQAAVAVAPMRAGSGQQLKLLEAMASGTPLVATPISAAGLEHGAAACIAAADTPEAFAAAVLAVLDDPAAARLCAQAAHALVAAHYTWASAAQRLESVWQAAAGVTAAAAAPAAVRRAVQPRA